MLFDEPYYIKINEVRWRIAKHVLDEICLKNKQHLSTCIDVGCGPGWFTEKLLALEMSVIGLEGRLELVQEAKRRLPETKFYHIDVESKTQILSIPAADLVFCFGLLYHTENPFRVIRSLSILTKKVLFIESIIIPESTPITWLVEEGKNVTQGLTHLAMIPSRTCVIKMLQSSGFEYVYEYLGKIEHNDFIETDTRYKRRGIFIASRDSLIINDFVLLSVITTPKYDFSKNKSNK